MLNYAKSLFYGKEKTFGWTNFKDAVENNCNLDIVDIPEGKQIIITNSGSGYHGYTLGVVFYEGEPIPGRNTQKGFKFHEFPGESNKLNSEGVIYKITVNVAQKVELARGKWKDVKFICIEQSEFTTKGAIWEEIDKVGNKENSRTELGRVKELIEEGHLVEGMSKSTGGEYNLHKACERGCYAIAELLIRSGINVNRDRDRTKSNGFGTFATSSEIKNERPIHIAATNGDLEMVKLLASSNAILDTKMIGPETGWSGDTPSQIASKKGFNEVSCFIDQANEAKKEKNSSCSIQ